MINVTQFIERIKREAIVKSDENPMGLRAGQTWRDIVNGVATNIMFVEYDGECDVYKLAFWINGKWVTQWGGRSYWDWFFINERGKVAA